MDRVCGGLEVLEAKTCMKPGFATFMKCLIKTALGGRWMRLNDELKEGDIPFLQGGCHLLLPILIK